MQPDGIDPQEPPSAGQVPYPCGFTFLDAGTVLEYRCISLELWLASQRVAAGSILFFGATSTLPARTVLSHQKPNAKHLPDSQRRARTSKRKVRRGNKRWTRSSSAACEITLSFQCALHVFCVFYLFSDILYCDINRKKIIKAPLHICKTVNFEL